MLSFYTTILMECKNCTYWDGGEIAGGNLDGTQYIQYVANNDTEVDDPWDYASNFTIHNVHGSFYLDLATAHSPYFSDYI